MALQEQHISYKFAGGIETKMDPEAVPAARLLTLENGVFARALSIKKRNGYESLSRAIDGSLSLISGAQRLAARDAELLQFTANRCYSKQSGADQWTDKGALIAPIGSDRAAVHTSTAQTTPDHVTVNGVTAYAWEDSLGGVWWTTVDAVSGDTLCAPTQANAAGERPRCVAVGTAIHIYYAIAAQRKINAIVIDTSTPATPVTETIVVTDLDVTNPVYDAVPTTRVGSPALLAWHEHATTNIRVGYVTANGALGSPASGNPSVGEAVIALAANSPIACAFKYVDGANADVIMLSYMTSTHGIVHAINGGTVSIPINTPLVSMPAPHTVYTSPTSVNRIALVETGGTAWAVFEEDAAAPSERYCIVNSVIVPAGSVGTEHTIRSLTLAARGFAVAGDTFAVFVHDTTYFNTYVTLRLSDFAPAGRHMPASACGPTRTHLPSVCMDGSVATISLAYKSRLASTTNDKFAESAIRLITMDFASDVSHLTATFGRGLYLAGACPQHYDGLRWTEQGFHVGPELISGIGASGGSMTSSSTYEYQVWYEWTDGAGEVHRGPTSVGIIGTTGGSDTQVTLTVPTLRVTRKNNVRICVARSLPGDTSSLFRVTSADPTTSGAAANGLIANDTTIDHIAFVDRMSDADLRLQEPLYTIGGILSNDPCALGPHVAVGKSRLFFTDAQDGNIVRFSQTLAAGFGAECAPELQQQIDPLGGDVTALAMMDDTVFVFKAAHIFAFNGDGPFADGTNTNSGLTSGFSSTQLIPSGVGCTDPASIVLTPQGLMFKSATGIHIISRSRDVTYVGAPVEAYNDQTVRRAVALPDRTAVLFLTDSGLSLYYDYLFQQWSTFTNHEGYDASVVGGVLHYLRENSVVYRETIDAYTDANTRITLRLETAWLHIHDHLQGFQRFWKLLLLGTWVSPHQLGVSYRMNYDESWAETYYLDATGDISSTGWITGDSANLIGEDPILGSNYGDGNYGDGPYGGSGPDVYQWRYGIYEKGQSIQFRFEDFEKAGLAGASFELTEMTIVGGVMQPDFGPVSGARST